jgi:Flp pilus assembly protein TadG
MKKNALIKDKQGYSTLFWALFLATVLVPLMAMTIELGRFFYARQAITNASDSAALAAATEIDRNLYKSNGSVILTPSVYSWAQKAALSSGSTLEKAGVNPMVGNIFIKGTTVTVVVSANLDLLFPSIVPDITITKYGTAQVKLLTK